MLSSFYFTSETMLSKNA